MTVAIVIYTPSYNYQVVKCLFFFIPLRKVDIWIFPSNHQLPLRFKFQMSSQKVRNKSKKYLCNGRKAKKVLSQRKEHGIKPLPADLIKRERPEFFGWERFEPLGQGQEFVILGVS